jgi:putative aldouronate transport system substrate-binding protein
MFITKNCKDPERAIKLKRFAYDNPWLIMYGEEGEDLDWYYPGGDKDAFPAWGARRQAHIDEGATLGDIYRTMNMQLSEVDYINMNRNFWNSATERTRDIQTEMQKKISFNNIIPFCAPMPGTDEQVIRTNLDSLRTDYFSRLGTANSEEEFERIYEEMMELANRVGLAAYNEYISARYEELSALSLFN